MTEEMITAEKKELELLPPPPDCCQECAVKHHPLDAHNKQSLYYQMKFYKENGRSPTWEDAIAHCPDDIKVAWRRELMKLGVNV